MNTEARPISISTAFSLALHAALLFALWQTQDVMRAAGEGVEIELVSSEYIAADTETEKAARQNGITSEKSITDELRARERISPADRDKVRETSVTDRLRGNSSQASTTVNEDTGDKVITRSTNTANYTRSIIDLLHTKISEHKQYPYLAKRQRREGTARVEFMLYPDGRIDAARLLRSSKTRSLDKAALNAVESIEPFSYARDYLERPETFQVDVVFNVM
ncbi:MAG: energy transducer TonB [Gammaproteobacteria bacterium]|nr:energy transducer TonB [Gammaproteobacteria bacterium]